MLSSMEMEMEEITGSVTLEAREARRQYLLTVQVSTARLKHSEHQRCVCRREMSLMPSSSAVGMADGLCQRHRRGAPVI